MSDAVALRTETRSELRRFWPAVLACFVTAVFGWGFGFTGTSVYLAELQRLHGWPTGTIAGAITAYYLVGALCLTRVHAALRWVGPGRLLIGGAVFLGVGSTLFARSQQPWHMFAAAALMGIGWAGCTSTAIATALALYFERQRGLAISLALNGASAAGFTVAPVLMALSHQIGVGQAVPIAAMAMLAIVVPMVVFGFPAPERPATSTAIGTDTALSIPTALRQWRFWSIALPFALALAAQSG